MKRYHVYVLADAKCSSLEVGATTALVQTIWRLRRERLESGPGRLTPSRRLVWVEGHDSAEQALRRERALRQWPREWLLRLVGETNPLWLDLYPGILHAGGICPSFSPNPSEVHLAISS